MFYKSRIYQLNSLRLGLIHEDNLYGKPTIFFNVGSQIVDIKQKIKKYLDLYDKKETNLIAIPYNLNNLEPGDDFEIISFYENFLGIKFYVTEKLLSNHSFFLDFGDPKKNFTEYLFNAQTKFIGINENE